MKNHRLTVPARFVVGLLVLLGAASAEAADAKDAAVETARKAIAACLDPSEDTGFDRYMEVIHPERKETETAVRDIRRYTWVRFRKQCRQFVKGDDLTTLEVTRIVPDPIPADAETFKLFFKPINESRRMPAPIIFRKDGDKWLIDTNSL